MDFATIEIPDFAFNTISTNNSRYFRSHNLAVISRLSLLAFLIFSVCNIHAQKTIHGVIKDRSTNEAIPFANLGIEFSNIGTVSNENGTFRLYIPSNHLEDSIVFMALGFERLTISIAYFNALKGPVFLHPKKMDLNTVVINDKKGKVKHFRIGNGETTNGDYEPDTLYSGRSVALLIKPSLKNRKKQFPAYIDKAKMWIARNNLDTCRFRIRIMSVDSLGQPDQDLLQQSVISEFYQSIGWLRFDLSKVNFVVDGPFFVVFEQLLNSTEHASIASGYNDFRQRYPYKFVTDSTSFKGSWIIQEKIIGSGSALPGTFIGMNSSEGAKLFHTGYIRKSSLSAWEQIPDVVTAVVNFRK